MLSGSGVRKIIEVDYEKDPFTDHEVIRGIDRRVGEDYGLGAADLAYCILEAIEMHADREECVNAIMRICCMVIETHRIARTAMFKERMGVRGR